MTSLHSGNAGPVVVCGVGFVVQCIGIGAALNFIGVTNAIAVGIEQAVPLAVVTGVREGAAAVVDDGRRVVVACVLVQTPAGQTREEVTGAVVHVGRGVVVARPHNGATRNLTRPIVKRGRRIKVGCLGVRATVTRRKVGARGGQGGGGVEVTRVRVHAPGTRDVFARAVAVVRLGIEVACSGIGAAKGKAGQEVAGAVVGRGTRIEVAGSRVVASGVGPSLSGGGQKHPNSKGNRKTASERPEGIRSRGGEGGLRIAGEQKTHELVFRL